MLRSLLPGTALKVERTLSKESDSLRKFLARQLPAGAGDEHVDDGEELQVFYLLKQTPSALELVLTDHIAQQAAEVGQDARTEIMAV